MPSRMQQSPIRRWSPALAVAAVVAAIPTAAGADTFCAPAPCSEGTAVGTIQGAIVRADSHSGPDTVAIGPGTHNLGAGVEVREPDTEVRGAGIGTTIVTADAVPADNPSGGRIVIAGSIARLSDLTVRLPSAVTRGFARVEGVRLIRGEVERVRVDMVGSSYNANGSPLGMAVAGSRVRDVEVAFPPAIHAAGVWIQDLEGERTQLTDVSISAQTALLSRPNPDRNAATVTARRVRLRGYQPLFVGGGGFLELSDSLIDARPAPPGRSDAVLVHNQRPPIRTGVTLDRVTVVGNGDPQSVAFTVAGLPGGGPSTFVRARHVAVAGFGRTLVHLRYGSDIAATIDYSNVDTSPGAIGDEGPGGGIVTDTLAPGNRAGDPLFVDPAAGTFRLQDGSPAIDVGGDDLIPGAPTDLGGDPRPRDGDGDRTILGDAGAYEHPTAGSAGGSGGGGGFHHHRPLDVASVERNTRTGAATLTLDMPGPARLVARGANIEPTSGQARTAGTTPLQIRPTPETLRRLDKAGTVPVKAIVTYMGPGGQLLTLTKAIELRKEKGAT